MADSVIGRMEQERTKALEKYGEISLLPSGHPDYDIFDYAINEVVGLHRYGEMIQARAIDGADWPMAVRHNLTDLGYRLRSFALQEGSALIEQRQQLLDNGHELGNPEKR